VAEVNRQTEALKYDGVLAKEMKEKDEKLATMEQTFKDEVVIVVNRQMEASRKEFDGILAREISKKEAEKEAELRKEYDDILAAKNAELTKKYNVILASEVGKKETGKEAELTARYNGILDTQIAARTVSMGNEYNEQFRQRMVDLDQKHEQVRQRMLDLDQKHEQRMAGLKQEHDTETSAAVKRLENIFRATVKTQVDILAANGRASHQRTVDELNDKITKLNEAATATANASRQANSQGLAIEKLKQDHAAEIIRLENAQKAVVQQLYADLAGIDQDYNEAMSNLDIERKKAKENLAREEEKVKMYKEDYLVIEAECHRLNTELLAARAAHPTTYLDPTVYDVPAFQRNAAAAVSPDYSKLPTVALLAAQGPMTPYIPPPASRPSLLPRGPAAPPSAPPTISPTSVPANLKRGPLSHLSRPDDESDESDEDNEDGGEEAVGLSDGEEPFEVAVQVRKD
jgi:hypothetical protein